MKGIVLLVFVIAVNFHFTQAQNQNNAHTNDSIVVNMQVPEIKSDSVKNIPNAVIQTNVNKDGVIEITRKEFNKIPPVRQEMILKDKNYKIIED
ncbi:MAG TPA: hypothetical protein PK323_13065 [Bacteroidia bacterium]|nr:hypothetical protein [Bacteroidia bacterium]